MTAAEPAKSPMTSRYAPRTVRLSRWASRSRNSEPAFAARPTSRHGQHQPRGDLGWVRQPSPGLDQDERRNPEQQNGVGDRGEDLEPQVAERAPAARRAGREPDREQRQPDPRDVGEHVPGVGEQGQAVRGDGAADLDDEDRELSARTRPAAADAPRRPTRDPVEALMRAPRRGWRHPGRARAGGVHEPVVRDPAGLAALSARARGGTGAGATAPRRSSRARARCHRRTGRAH